jgi:hypothetical protein
MSPGDRDFMAAEPHLRIGVQTAWMDDRDPELSASDTLRVLIEQTAMVGGSANLGARGAEFLALLGQAGIDPSDADFKATRDDLLALAIRIARNREIAGLHYPSDSAAGRELADIVLRKLTGLQELTGSATFVNAVNAAAHEWREGGRV